MNTKYRIIAFVVMLVLVCATAYAAGSERDYRKANNLVAKKNYSQAITLYQALLVDPPRSASKSALHSRIADCYFQLEDYRHARDAYRKALDGQSETKKPETQYWIAFSTLLMGNNKEALTEFLKIPNLYPDSGMWVSTAYYWAGRVCERMGSEEQAAVYFSKAGGKGKSAQERFALEKAKQAKGK
jgi:tetratricopeptide (TPR) repeat protein